MEFGNVSDIIATLILVNNMLCQKCIKKSGIKEFINELSDNLIFF